MEVKAKDAGRINNAATGAGLAGAGEAKAYIGIAVNTGGAAHQELLNIGAQKAINGSGGGGVVCGALGSCKKICGNCTAGDEIIANFEAHVAAVATI